MRLLTLLSTALLILLTSCNEKNKTSQNNTTPPNGFVRVNATLQEFSEVQPWDRKAPVKRRGLGALLPNKKILTTSEMVAHQVYLELESADGEKSILAKVVALDRAVNLALLEPIDMEEDSFLDTLTPLTLSEPLKITDKVETWQLESNGQPTITKTNIHSVDVVSSHSFGKRFFSYQLKGSLQSASNSYTVPVIAKGKLAGLLTSYDSDEQISEVVAANIIQRFLTDTEDGDYTGFPSLGIAGARMPNQAFRDWVGLKDTEEGLYITRIAGESSAAEAGLQVGDVLMKMDGLNINFKGYYDDPMYGKLTWTHLIRGTKAVGDTITLTLKREGKIIEKEATLKQSSTALIPSEYDTAGPQYLFKGGVVFQQLTKTYLMAYGKEWASRAPLNLLDLYYQPEKYEEHIEEAVIITRIIPGQGTVGYENVRNCIVEDVNGIKITKMADLEKGFSAPHNGIHSLKLSEAPYQLYLNAQDCENFDRALQAQGLSALKRIH